MPQQYQGPTWPHGARPDDGEPHEVDPDDGDEYWDDDDEGGDRRSGGRPAPPWPAPPWPAPPQYGPGGGEPRRPRAHPLTMAAIAVAAAAAGAVVAVVLMNVPRSTPSAATSPTPTPSVVRPTRGSGGGFPGGAIPGGGDAPRGQQVMMMVGPVTAISSASITLGGPGRSVTAAITSATRFTGQAKNAAAVKVGDQVAAQITGSGSHLVARVIQDPAQAA